MSHPVESLNARSDEGVLDATDAELDGLASLPDLRAEWLDAGAAVLDESGGIVSLNDALASWLAVKSSDVAAQNFGEVLSARDAEAARKFVELWQVGGPFAQAEIPSAGDSARQWFSIETSRFPGGGHVRIASQLPPLNELGENGWDTFMGSETSRRDMYVRLLRAEAQLDNWIHRWPGVVFSQRADFSFSFVSNTIKAMTGIAPHDWRTHPQRFWQVVHEADAEDLQKMYRGFSTSNRRQNATYRIRHSQTGRISYVFEHREAIYSSNGLLLGYEGVWLDVTRQTIAEKRLSTAAWKETLAVLTMGLAHDFSNIMAGILSLSEAFQAQVDREHPFQEGLALIKRNSMQASQMVHRILNLHHGKVGERNYHNLNELVKDTVEVMRKIIPRRIEVVTEFSSDGLPLYVDAVEFRQVLINLTLNASDAMPQGGKLTLKTSLHTKIVEPQNLQGVMPRVPIVCLSVSDTGHGIASRNLAAIFDPFFTTKAMNKGSGLGLYNARLFTEKHRGGISVESAENAGTTFRIWLPQADFTESERDEDRASNKRHTVLVVGPELIAEPSARFLREQGFYTVVAQAPERAAELLNSPDYQFDALLGILSPDDFTPAAMLDRLAGQSHKLKKILQIVGCNQDEIDTQILARADLVLPTDISEPEMISKLAAALAPVQV